LWTGDAGAPTNPFVTFGGGLTVYSWNPQFSQFNFKSTATIMYTAMVVCNPIGPRTVAISTLYTLPANGTLSLVVNSGPFM